MRGHPHALEVVPRIPARLDRLPELAGNLVYSWDRDLRRLFRHLDNELYERCGGNLKLFLRRVPQAAVDRAAADPAFQRAYHQVLSAYDSFHLRKMPADLAPLLDPESDLVAYFCLEFGFHESLPVYSGGLGILAADHCKAAADLAVPLVAVGLMYHQGYFEQRLDAHGGQVEHYVNTDLHALPLEVVHASDGSALHIEVPVGGQRIRLRVWRGHIGHLSLYLLDSELPDNPPELRDITHRLYGGGPVNRIRQEFVLGVGGVRLLRALGLRPTVWHLNEGHSAFQALERIREFLAAGSRLEEALELVASNTVFTTHTPVPAGHDVFDLPLVEAELGPFLTDMGMAIEDLLALGRNGDPQRLNMTALALRTSRFRNGVSRVHGDIAGEGCRFAWPDVPPAENPVTYVTNGVHLQTFLALEWVNYFDVRFSGWRSNLSDEAYWQCIDEIPNHQFRSIRKELKSQLFANIAERLLVQHRRNGMAESAIERTLEIISNDQHDVLALGFARRFATYKRATLIFSDHERLARLLNDPERPVVILMAGKAHPEDEPGKALIRHVHALSLHPDFIGKVHLIENYDLALARALVSGVDVWLNTPEHPQEASGTSGMKAAMNGVINLSVLDGWWAEGFDGANGWGIRPHGQGWAAEQRHQPEAEDLLEILEKRVIPLYFDRRDSDGWAQMAKASMRSIIPRFNAERMVRDYVARLYAPALRYHRRLAADGADALIDWKRTVAECWAGVTARLTTPPPTQVPDGEAIEIAVEAELNGLAADHVCVECLVRSDRGAGEPGRERVYAFTPEPADAAASAVSYRLTLQPPFSGLQRIEVRVYPVHPRLSHRFEMGRMLWL